MLEWKRAITLYFYIVKVNLKLCRFERREIGNYSNEDGICFKQRTKGRLYILLKMIVMNLRSSLNMMKKELCACLSLLCA